MNARIHNTAMKMGVGGPKVLGARFLPPFQGSRGWGFHPGFRRSGSTLGYIPAAASRLKVFAILPDINVMHDDLEGYFPRRHSRIQWPRSSLGKMPAGRREYGM